MTASGRKQLFLSLEFRLTLLLWLIYLLIPYLVVPERYGYSLAPSELAIKAGYLVLALLNNYYLIPRLLHKGRYVLYTATVLGVVLLGALFEERVLENIFFPDTRGGAMTLRAFQWSVSKIGFVLILFSAFKLIWDYQKKQKQLAELEKQKIESELKFLKSQINPHVLFNNLNNIYSYALERSEKVPEMLLKLSEIMRYMLQEGDEEFVPLDKEIQYLKDFVELQKLRLEERGEVRLQIEGETRNRMIAPLLLVAFVENSFKHSMRSEVEDIEIDISIRVEGRQLLFTSRNTFSGENLAGTVDTGRRETGIGLQNVQKRLQLIYAGKHRLDLRTENGYFVVNLTLDLAVDEPEVLDY